MKHDFSTLDVPYMPQTSKLPSAFFPPRLVVVTPFPDASGLRALAPRSFRANNSLLLMGMVG